MRKRNKIFIMVIASFSMMCICSCIETFETKFEDFESALVFEAIITDELKQHEVKVTRTYEFEDEGPEAESNADVRIVDGTGNTFVFQETLPGTYVSNQSFAAQSGTTYQLSVTTNDGRSYSSTVMEMTESTTIDEVSAQRITNDEGVDGMAIYVDSFDPSGNSVNYRYEYEETYKIIAPRHNKNTLEILFSVYPECEARIVPREVEERVCYATNLSNRIIQTTTSELDEDRVDKFLVRFIPSDDFILSHRYSILVRQYVQSNIAYSFYETLNELSGNESLFSETQPGFLIGNVSSDNSRDEKVLGYFDVCATNEKRIFFDYKDFYPDEPLPPYIVPCVESSPLEINHPPGTCPLIRQIELDIVELIGENEGQFPLGGPFIIVPRECGDCTALGSNIQPDFWLE